MLSLTFNLFKTTRQLNRICFYFARGKYKEPILSFQQNNVIKNLTLTFSALLQIQKRKPQLQQTKNYIKQQQWDVKKKGHLIQFQRTFLNKQISVVFQSLKYPVKQQPIQPITQNNTYKQEAMYESIVDQQPQRVQTASTYLQFKVYIRRINTPTYLIIYCSMSTFQGLHPYAIDFTTKKQDNILGNQIPTWNKIDDLNYSATDYFKRYLQVMGVNYILGDHLLKYKNNSLKQQYKQWIKDMKAFIKE